MGMEYPWALVYGYTLECIPWDPRWGIPIARQSVGAVLQRVGLWVSPRVYPLGYALGSTHGHGVPMGSGLWAYPGAYPLGYALGYTHSQAARRGGPPESMLMGIPANVSLGILSGYTHGHGVRMGSGL